MQWQFSGLLAGILALAVSVRAAEPAAAPKPTPEPQPTAEPKPPATFPGAALLNSQPPFLAGVKVNHADLQYREDDHLKIEFTAERDAHLYLLYHQADGSTRLLFPNEAAAKNLVPGKQTVTIPAAGDEFRFRVRPPFGAEVVQVLATLQPLAELDQLVQKTGRAAVVPGSVLAALAARLPREPTGWTEHRVPVRTLAKEALPPARAASRVGLFIGVNKYQDEKMCSPGERFRLGAELMAKTLVERGGIEAKHAKTIVAEQATKANIEEAIVRWLPSVSQPGDTVFVFYAGHGGTLKNLDGSKPDGRDGLLTTFDNDLGSGIKSQEEYDARSRRKMITDDALARWLQELPGRQIVLLLSTCHAGAQIDAQVLSKFFAQQAARVKGISQLNVAVVAGCAPDESGYSDPSKPVWMAFYMAEAMQRQNPPVTLRQAYDHYRQGQKRFLEELSKKSQSRITGVQDPMFIENTLLPIVLVAGSKSP